MIVEILSGEILLKAHLAGEPGAQPGDQPSARTGASKALLVLCHGFPSHPRRETVLGQTYAQLADRLSSESGWAVLTFSFRGTGESGGDFSIGGWMDDLRAVLAHSFSLDWPSGVWLAGFSTGAALAICAAAEDERVRGVACFAAPTNFDRWANDPNRLAARARELGIITTPGWPPDLDAWRRELEEINPVDRIGKITPRPVLIVHGSDDDVVPPASAREFLDAAGSHAEHSLLTGAAHQLRHDPRALAVLLGWMGRQEP